MSSYALSLIQAPGSFANLDIVPFRESSSVEEEAWAAVEAPLAFHPPSQDFSSSLKSTACSRIIKDGVQKKKPTPVRPTTGALGPKKKSLGGGGLSKGATVKPSSSEEPSLSSPVYDNRSYII